VTSGPAKKQYAQLLAELRTARAKALVGAGRTEEARELVNDMVRVAGAGPYEHFLAAGFFALVNDIERGREELRAALREDERYGKRAVLNATLWSAPARDEKGRIVPQVGSSILPANTSGG